MLPVIQAVLETVEMYNNRSDPEECIHPEAVVSRALLLGAFLSTLALPFALAAWGKVPLPRPWRRTAELAVILLPNVLFVITLGSIFAFFWITSWGSHP